MTTNITADGGVPAIGGHRHFGVMEKLLDFSASGAATAADEVVPVFSVPADTFVLAVLWDVETAEGATLTFDIGDGDDDDGFVDGANGNATGTGHGTAAGFAGTAGTLARKWYTSADTIDMTTKNAADAAKIRVKAIVVDVSNGLS